MEYLHWAGSFLVYALIGLLCLGGLTLALFSLSGTWLVVAAAVIAALWRTDPFPGAWTLAGFVLIAAAVEVIEMVATWKGVTRRGGSGWTGLASFAGAILGGILFSPLPPPLLAPLAGAVAGAFAAAYGFEWLRWRRRDSALRVAWGTVIARLIVMTVKLTATLAMILWLVLGIVF